MKHNKVKPSKTRCAYIQDRVEEMNLESLWEVDLTSLSDGFDDDDDDEEK